MRSGIEVRKSWRTSVNMDPLKPQKVGFRCRGASIFMNSTDLRKVTNKPSTSLQNDSKIEPKWRNRHFKKHQNTYKRIITRSHDILIGKGFQIGPPKSDFFVVFGVPGPGWPPGPPGQPPRPKKVPKWSLWSGFPRINLFENLSWNIGALSVLAVMHNA